MMMLSVLRCLNWRVTSQIWIADVFVMIALIWNIVNNLLMIAISVELLDLSCKESGDYYIASATTRVTLLTLGMIFYAAKIAGAFEENFSINPNAKDMLRLGFTEIVRTALKFNQLSAKVLNYMVVYTLNAIKGRCAAAPQGQMLSIILPIMIFMLFLVAGIKVVVKYGEWRAISYLKFCLIGGIVSFTVGQFVLFSKATVSNEATLYYYATIDFYATAWGVCADRIKDDEDYTTDKNERSSMVEIEMLKRASEVQTPAAAITRNVFHDNKHDEAPKDVETGKVQWNRI